MYFPLRGIPAVVLNSTEVHNCTKDGIVEMKNTPRFCLENVTLKNYSISCQRFGAAVVQPHNQDGVIHVAMKRMPHIITEGNAQVFKLQLPWFKTVRLILCALNAESRALSAIRFIQEIAKLNFVGSAQ